MKSNSIKSKWQIFKEIWKKCQEYYNQYDIGKYILNLSYYGHTKKFGTHQVKKVKYLHIFTLTAAILFFCALIIQVTCCIIKDASNDLYGIGIGLCGIWALLTIFITPATFFFNSLRYYYAIKKGMKNGSLDPVATNYPKPIYTVLWFYKTKPMSRASFYETPNVIIQTWYEGSKAVALFIDRLNEYYLNHHDDLNKATKIIPIN